MSLEKLRRCFVEAFNISEDTDFESLKYRGIEQWDSLAHMQLVVAIESTFDIMLETDDVIDMSSFNKAKEILVKYGNELTLEDKIAFVTGSTRGIGWATACALAAHKATVVLNGHNNEALLQDRTAEIRAEYGVESLGILANAGDPGQVKVCYQQIFKRYKRLDILVNNAGILDDNLLGMIADTTIEKTFAINTIGYIQHLQGAARLMARNHSGSIVNVASIIGIRGNAGQVVYGASKAAVIGMTLSAAKELAEKNIRVNAVAPGVIETDMIKQLDKEKLDSLVASIQMGHIGKPEDVADVILFLASDLSRYVTGQVITVDGGMII